MQITPIILKCPR